MAALQKIKGQQSWTFATPEVEADRARVIPGWLVALTVTAASVVPIALLRYGLNKRGR